MQNTEDTGGMTGLLVSPKQRLLDLFVTTGSFHVSATPEYPLASGILSPYYIDCKRALSYPETRRLVGDLIFTHLQTCQADAVGGLVLGAIPVAIAVSDAADRQSTLLKVFAVRKEAKRHGLRKYIEGDVRTAERVIIVDDVITSGASTIDAIHKSREEGLQVVKAVAIIDREEANGRQAIEQLGVPFASVLTLKELIARIDAP